MPSSRGLASVISRTGLDPATATWHTLPTSRSAASSPWMRRSGASMQGSSTSRCTSWSTPSRTTTQTRDRSFVVVEASSLAQGAGQRVVAGERGPRGSGPARPAGGRSCAGLSTAAAAARPRSATDCPEPTASSLRTSLGASKRTRPLRRDIVVRDVFRSETSPGRAAIPLRGDQRRVDHGGVAPPSRRDPRRRAEAEGSPDRRLRFSRSRRGSPRQRSRSARGFRARCVAP